MGGLGPGSTRRAAAVAAAVLLACPAARADGPAPPAPPDATVALDRRGGGGGVAPRFVGLSIEWSLVERYMGDAARPVFANLLRNLGAGELRIGGSSQDQMPFDATAANSNQVITPQDVLDVRRTLDDANAPSGDGGARAAARWITVLGTTLAPPGPRRPWAGPEHARAFVSRGVLPAFAGAERTVAGIGLGNEPDLTYGFDLARYLADLAAHRDAGVTAPFAMSLPSTSEPIAPWQAIQARSVPTRFFWDWPAILDAIVPAADAERRRALAGNRATDHFYPLARGCASDEYRCATIERLLSDERLSNLAFQVYAHAVQAARHGLGYRLQETNTAAGRGVDGVSNVAASAIWALAAMFEAACPQPPDAPGANATCAVGASGINLHNAEVRAFFFPEEGNAFYNAVRYDPSPAMGAPSAAPPYYAMLLFAGFAQRTRGLRPLAVAPGPDPAARVRAWQATAGAGERRLFVLNLSGRPLAVDVRAPGARYELHRMAPVDPSGAGRTLDAPQVRIDGRAVAADGSWPGFAPQRGRLSGGRMRLRIGTAEAAVVVVHGRGEQ